MGHMADGALDNISLTVAMQNPYPVAHKYAADFAGNQLDTSVWSYNREPVIANELLYLGSGNPHGWGAVGTAHTIGRSVVEADIKAVNPNSTATSDSFFIGVRVKGKSELFTNSGLWFGFTPRQQLRVQLGSSSAVVSTLSALGVNVKNFTRIRIEDNGDTVKAYAYSALGRPLLLCTVSIADTGITVSDLPSGATLNGALSGALEPAGYVRLMGHGVDGVCASVSIDEIYDWETNIVFQYDEGEEINTIAGNDNVTVSLSAKRTMFASAPIKFSLVTAVYDGNGVLTNVTEKPFELSDDTPPADDSSVVDATDAAKIRCFLWDGMSGMKPLADAVQIP
jgi:hypothetical protein